MQVTSYEPSARRYSRFRGVYEHKTASKEAGATKWLARISVVPIQRPADVQTAPREAA